MSIKALKNVSCRNPLAEVGPSQLRHRNSPERRIVRE